MSAIFSTTRLYRYTLVRGPFVGWPGTRVAFVGLNPSTADETADDPTVRRCIGFARDWMFERMVMLNVFAYRSTDPKQLQRIGAAVATGPENDEHILREALAPKTTVVCAWGTHAQLGGRGEAVAKMLTDAGVTLYVLGLTKGGYPRHPLYLRRNLELALW